MSDPRRRSRIPEQSVSRLAVYHRELQGLLGKGRTMVASSELAEAIGVNAATLRRDLSRLGSYGLRGTGYDVNQLLERVDHALALDKGWSVVIVGVGNLGRALAGSRGFNSGGFNVAALVDVDRAVVGTSLGSIRVHHLDELASVIEGEDVAIGVVATPASTAQDVVDRLVDNGVSTILNFAPAAISAPAGVALRSVDLAAELRVLAFYGANALGADEQAKVVPTGTSAVAASSS